jgi:hypothetical protein
MTDNHNLVTDGGDECEFWTEAQSEALHSNAPTLRISTHPFVDQQHLHTPTPNPNRQSHVFYRPPTTSFQMITDNHEGSNATRQSQEKLQLNEATRFRTRVLGMLCTLLIVALLILLGVGWLLWTGPASSIVS